MKMHNYYLIRTVTKTPERMWITSYDSQEWKKYYLRFQTHYISLHRQHNTASIYRNQTK